MVEYRKRQRVKLWYDAVKGCTKYGSRLRWLGSAGMASYGTCEAEAAGQVASVQPLREHLLTLLWTNTRCLVVLALILRRGNPSVLQLVWAVAPAKCQHQLTFLAVMRQRVKV